MILIAAQTNIAVDNALEQLALHHEDSHDGAHPPAGTMVRCGEPRLAALQRRLDLNLPALTASGLLQRTLSEAEECERERTEAIAAHGKVIIAWKEAVRAHGALEARPAPPKGFWADCSRGTRSIRTKRRRRKPR